MPFPNLFSVKKISTDRARSEPIGIPVTCQKFEFLIAKVQLSKRYFIASLY